MSPRQLVPAGWHALRASSHELRLASTLENGQCFGWHRQACEEPVWVGVLGRRLLALRETESDCLFRCLSSLPPPPHGSVVGVNPLVELAVGAARVARIAFVRFVAAFGARLLQQIARAVIRFIFRGGRF